MPYEDFLVHRADIFAPPAARGVPAVDRFGQPAEPPSPEVGGAPSQTGVHCYLDWVKGSQQMTDRTRGVLVATPTLYLLTGTNIHEDDFVTVYDETGELLTEFARVVVVSRPRSGLTGTHHVEAQLATSRDPEDRAEE